MFNITKSQEGETEVGKFSKIFSRERVLITWEDSSVQGIISLLLHWLPLQLARVLLHKNVKDLLANHPMLADKMLFNSSREFLLTRKVLSIGATKVKRQIEAVAEGWE